MDKPVLNFKPHKRQGINTMSVPKNHQNEQVKQLDTPKALINTSLSLISDKQRKTQNKGKVEKKTILKCINSSTQIS